MCAPCLANWRGGGCRLLACCLVAWRFACGAGEAVAVWPVALVVGCFARGAGESCRLLAYCVVAWRFACGAGRAVAF